MVMKIRDCLSKLAEARDAKAKTLADAQVILDAAMQSGAGLDAAGKAKYDALLGMAKTQDLSIKNWEQQYQDALAADGKSMGGGGSPYSFDGDANSVRSGVDRASLDPNGGFSEAGEFWEAVVNAGHSARAGNPVSDPRLIKLMKNELGFSVPSGMASVPSTSINSNSGAGGGFALPPTFQKQIWTLASSGSVFLPITDPIRMGEDDGDSMELFVDKTPDWDDSYLSAYWVGDGMEIPKNGIKLERVTIQANDIACIIPVTKKMQRSRLALDSHIRKKVPQKMGYKIDHSILYGNGINKPFGCLNSPSVVVVQKEDGQAAKTITQANISEMASRMLIDAYGDSVWVANQNILPQLHALKVGNMPIFIPMQTGFSDYGFIKGGMGLLLGRPLILSTHANSLGEQGDLSLISLKSGYQAITYGDNTQPDESAHVYFDAAISALRFDIAVGGAPILQAPLTPPNSTSTQSHFITLGERK